MGNNIRLVVKISESKKHREERKQLLKQEEEFSKTLSCAQSSSFDQLDDSEEESEKVLSNPLQPCYVAPKSADSNLIKSPKTSTGVNNSPAGIARPPIKVENKGCMDNSDQTVNHCHVCQEIAVNRCSRCKTAYCSTQCQQEDWPQHKNECMQVGSTTPKGTNDILANDAMERPRTPDICIAEGSDDEGFVLDCPSPEDLLEVKQILLHTKTSEDLMNTLAESTSLNSGSLLSQRERPSMGKLKRITSSDGEVSTQSIQSSIAHLSLGPSSVIVSDAEMSPADGFVSLHSIQMQLEQMKMLPSIPPLSNPPSEFPAIITFYISPCEFYAVIPSFEIKQALQLIRSIGHTLSPGKLSTAQLTQGSKCGLCDDSGEFKRVVIQEIISSTKVLVFDYDFGGRHSVPVSCLVHLPEELLLIPCLSRRCALHEVEVTDQTTSCLNRAIASFKQFVDGQPVLITNFGFCEKSILCTVKTKDGGCDLISFLLKNHYIKKNPNSEQVIPLRLSYPASKVEYHHVKPGTVINIFPTVVKTPSIIWAQVDHPHHDTIKAMHKIMNKKYPPADATSNPYVPAKGEMCVAKYSQDQKYYRAEVGLIHHNGMVDIRFTETGRCDSVMISQLYHIIPDFLSLPRQARKFCLSGVEPNQSITWSNNAIAFIKDKTLNRKITAKVLSVVSDVVVVEMFDVDLPNQLLNNSLILLGHAQMKSQNVETAASSHTCEELRKEHSSPPSNFQVQETVTSDPPTPESSRPSSASSDRAGMTPGLKSLQLSEGDFIEVCFSHVNALERFYLQMVEPSHFSKVESVLGKIQDLKLVPLPSRYVQKGTVCLCRYSEDNEVHRALIVSVTEQNVTVAFKDYGNVYRCSKDALYKITDELLRLPFQSIACSLNQVKNPAGNKKQWDTAALTHFRKLLESWPLKAKVVKVVGMLHVVDLQMNTSQGVVDVLSAMIDAGFVSSHTRNRNDSQSVTKKFPSTPVSEQKSFDKLLSSRSPRSAEKPMFKKTSKEVRSQEQDRLVTRNENTMSSTQDKVINTMSSTPKSTAETYKRTASVKEKDSCFPEFSSLRKIAFSNDVKDVNAVVTEVTNLNEIYVQIVSDESVSAMTSINQCLKSMDSNLPPSMKAPPPVSSLCVAKYSQDNMWYRCKVEHISSSIKASVQFIDFGNRDEVDISAIFPCPIKCLSFPVIAVRCSLAGVSAMQVHEQRAIEFVKEKTMNYSMVSVQVISQDANVPCVNIVMNDSDLTQQMITLSILKQNLFPKIKVLENMCFPSNLSNVRVVVSEVASHCEVYIHIASNDVKELLMKIGTSLNTALSSNQTLISNPPPVESLCCAKFSADSHWYRAEVLESGDSSCLVRFVDYGNKETVCVGDILSCPVDFHQYPKVAIRCILHGLQDITSSEADLVMQYLSEQTAGKFFSPDVVDGGDSDSTVFVSLRNDQGFSLVDELQSLKLIKVGGESVSFVNDLSKVQLPENEEFPMLIGEFFSPNKFYVQLGTVENRRILSKINEGLNSANIKPLDSTPEKGTLCCARFSLDKQWYRAEVLSVNQGQVRVFYVDYGNHDDTALNDLAYCPSSLSSLPLQAVECGLSGLPSQLTSSREVSEYLHKNLSECLLKGKVENILAGTYQLTILKEHKNVIEELLLSIPAVQIHEDYFVKDLESVALPGKEFKAVVCEVISLSQFYIQVASVETSANLEIITKGINDVSKHLSPLPGRPQVGCLYCANFSADKQWYRVEVIEVAEHKSKVFFLEYGNTDEVSDSDLAICPKEFAVLPKLALECSLRGLTSDMLCNNSCVSFFQENVLNTLVIAHVTASESVLVVELFKDGGSVLNEVLKMVGSDSTNESVLVENMEQVKLPSSCSFKALVTAIVSPTEIYIQLDTQEVRSQENRIAEHLNISEEKVALKNLTVGALCCAKFPLDSNWYRAKIISIGDAGIEVFLIDCGNSGTVPPTNIAACPQEISDLPCIASRCALHDLPSNVASSDAITLRLRKSLSCKLVSVRVVHVSEACIFVEIIQNEKNVLVDLAEAGFLKSSICLNLVKDMENVSLPEIDRFPVVLSGVKSHKNFYAQLGTPKAIFLLQSIEEAIARASSSFLPLPEIPCTGSLCIVKSSRQCFRAEAMEVVDDGIAARYIDNGNTEWVNLSDLAACPDELAELPCCTFKCELGNLPGNVSSAEVDEVLKRQANNTLLARVVGHRNKTPQMEFFEGDINILMQLSQARGTHIPDKKQNVSLPSGEDFQVLVTEAVSPCNFYVQLATSEVGRILHDITDIINRDYPPLKPLNSIPSEGSFCCARYSQDRQWYRAEILDINSLSSCKVFFVDFGNIEIVELSDLAECPSECVDLPLVGCKCSLWGISPGKELSSEVSAIFKQLVVNGCLVSAKLIAEKNTFFQVELFNNQGDNLGVLLQEKIDNSTFPIVSNMKRIQIPSLSKLCSVSVTEMHGLQRIHVQFATQDVAIMLNDLSDGLREVFEAEHCGLESVPSVGSLCCAKYCADGLWYRAEIMAVESNKVTVQFIDYGNTDTLSLSSLARCPSKFTDFPVLGVCCSLSDISSESLVSVDATVQFLKEVTYDVGATLKVVDVADGVPNIKLFIDGTDVNTLLLNKGLMKRVICAADTLPTLKFPSTSKHVKCLICGIESLSDFYVHVNNEERSRVLSQIESTISKALSNGSPASLTCPSIGNLCLAKYSEDNMWYRAKVLKVCEEVCHVLYMDYHNFEKVHISNMAACPKAIESLPQVAIRCSLHGLPCGFDPNPKQIAAFKKLLNNDVLEGKLVCLVDDVYHLELLKGGKNVLDLMGIVPAVDAPLFSNMNQLGFSTSGERFQVLVCELHTPNELYVQVNNTITCEAVHSVTDKLKDVSDGVAPCESFPPAGSVCVAKFSQDGMWYRVRIESVLNDKCKVFFFDYGNFEEVPLNNLIPCSPDLLEIPVIAVKCALHGLENFSQDWSTSAKSVLKTLTMGRLLNASVVSSKSYDTPVVQLSDVGNGTLISAEFRNKYQPSGTTVAPLHKCQITEMSSPSSLFFQYLEADNTNILGLLNQLQEVYANPNLYAGFSPRVGSLCCAQFTEDMKWYRCKVLTIVKETVSLSYIDFGSVEEVPKNKIYRLDDSFASVPPFAHHAKIRGIGPKEGNVWSKSAVNKVADLCDEKILFLTVVHQDDDDDGITAVDLFEDEERHSNIADILVSGGHATYI